MLFSSEQNRLPHDFGSKSPKNVKNPPKNLVNISFNISLSICKVPMASAKDLCRVVATRAPAPAQVPPVAPVAAADPTRVAGLRPTSPDSVKAGQFLWNPYEIPTETTQWGILSKHVTIQQSILGVKFVWSGGRAKWVLDHDLTPAAPHFLAMGQIVMPKKWDDVRKITLYSKYMCM